MRLSKTNALRLALDNGCVHASEQSLGEACAQQTILEEALASEGKEHPLFSLPARYREWALVRGARDSALQALMEKLEECRRWSAMQSAAMSALSSGTAPERWLRVLNAEPALESVGSLAPLVEFLQSSGQLQLLQQCEQSEGELLAFVQQMRQAMHTAVDLLGTYAAIVVQGPPARLAPAQSPPAALATLVGRASPGVHPSQVSRALAQHYELQSAVADCNSHIMAVLKRKQTEGPDYLPDAQTAVLSLAQDPSQKPAVVAALLGALCPCAQNMVVLETTAAASA
ncbi:hypothetical protein MRX96_041721 [Rhipicephalus microplus]